MTTKHCDCSFRFTVYDFSKQSVSVDYEAFVAKLGYELWSSKPAGNDVDVVVSIEKVFKSVDHACTNSEVDSIASTILDFVETRTWDLVQFLESICSVQHS